MSGEERRRWSFRTRLTALIAGIFVLGGAAMLTVQYRLAQELLSQGVSGITACAVSATDSPSDGESVVEIEIGSELDPEELCDPASAGAITASGHSAVVIEQVNALSDGVLGGLLLGSIITLTVFAVLAVVAASWLSRRSLGRIASITEATRQIHERDLHRRLELPGPRDEIKELGDTIDGMLDRLDDAFARQERFIAGASHELRTPLTTTRTALEIPLSQGRVPEELTADLEKALAANRRSEELIATLLTLAHSTHAGRPAHTESAAMTAGSAVDLRVLVTGAVADMAGDATAGDVELLIEEDAASGEDAARALPVASGALAEIAVRNLVENAVRHNIEGGRVWIDCGREAATARLRVANDGAELTADDVTRLTEPFHRGRGTRLAGGGTGLGLTLVETIARSLEGSLHLCPRAGGGLAVTLRLPMAEAPAPTT